MKIKPFLLSRLMVRFLWHCVLSGLTTARMILVRRSPPAGLVKMKYEPMSHTGVAILGAVVTLTPGSSTVDINLEQREILLHLLDVRTAEESIAGIRRNFEQDIRELFPKDQL
jgi:multicomponent K+:H+ antiporter subunit E/multicomponent Na+:H+ antiporter subunit E